MMNSEQKIIDYLQGRLDMKSSAEFEMELKQNPELQVAFNETKNLQAAIKESERRELKLRLAALSKGVSPENNVKKQKVRSLKKRYLILVAASILPIIFVVNNFFSTTISNTSLYENYYSTYPNTLQPIVRSDETSSTKKDAFLAYETGEYKKSATIFKTLLEAKNNPDIRFYYAMSLLNSHQDKQALSELNLIKKDTTLYKPQTYWYAALLELKSGNEKKSIQLIDSLLLLKSGFKDTQAKELQHKLKN